MPISFRSIFLSRKALWLYPVEAALLAVSAFGLFWGAHDLFVVDAADRRPLVFLVLFGVLPLTLFVFIAIREAVAAARMGALSGFQHRIDELQKRLNAQDDFYCSINSNMPTTLTIYDNRNAYWFVNASAARELGFSENKLLGKKPTEILGPERGRAIAKILKDVRESGKPRETLDSYADEKGTVRHIQTRYQFLAPFGMFPGGIMARGDDITSTAIERERREAMLRQVISTLVAVVDRRDPYATGHSAHVGFLSRALAAEMNLQSCEIEAAEIAGSLMNFGKVLVSRSILTKTATLTPEELQRIRDGIATSADILSLIDFGAPVVPTLRQVLERFDGRGLPQRLKGDAILVTARIVAVANAFVALVSPRAYRPGLDVAIALQRLAEDKGKAFDPQVITALEVYLGKNAKEIEWLAGK
ncbi:MAG: HD domain-containing phosphohydrolase [Alphaproteobacteria bacterium]|nr:HD domain-containing phosphohydrolase [Alphaproteobacteria bacterium]